MGNPTGPLSWEARERLHLSPPPARHTVEDDLTEVISVLERMLTEYHETRPRKPLRKRNP